MSWTSYVTRLAFRIAVRAAVFDLSPNEFAEFSEEEQTALNDFVADVLDGKVKPKATQ